MEYRAISTDRKYAAVPKIKILITIMMSPIVAPNFLLKYIANTSVPSMTAPPLMESPIPAPRKKPPNNATNKLSFVILGNSTVATTNASPVIARAVLIANVRPIVKYPIIINGIFGWKPFHTIFTKSEWFAFTASYLGAISSVFIGVVALYQSKRYKEQADDYSKKMDELILLPEIYPMAIKKVSEINAENYKYYRLDGVDDRLSEGQDYNIDFIVIKNPVINLAVVSFTADYYNDNHIKSRILM